MVRMCSSAILTSEVRVGSRIGDSCELLKEKKCGKLEVTTSLPTHLTI